GHEATVNVTGNGWWALFRNPDQLALLQPTCHWSPAPSRSSCATTLPSRCSSDGSWRTRTSVASACRRGRSSGSCSAQRTTTHPSFISPTSWTSPGRRIPTCPSGPGSTSAWERRWPDSSWRLPSPPCFAGFHGWSWWPSHDGSPLTSSEGWESSGSGSESQGARGLAIGDRRVGRSRRDARSRHDAPRATFAPDLEHRNEALTREHLAVPEELEERGEEQDNP